MIAPTLPGQSVQVAPLGAGYKQVPQATNAPILGAVGQAAQQFGSVAEKQARLLQARADQTVIWTASAEARKMIDAADIAHLTLDGQPKLESSGPLLADFRKWADTRGVDMTPEQRDIFNEHVEGLAQSASAKWGVEDLNESQKMAGFALATGIQQNTKSAFGAAVSGAVTVRQSPRSTAPGYPSDSSRTTDTLDESAIKPQWNAIESMIDDWGKSHPRNEDVVAEKKRRARADFDASVLEGLMTATPNKAIDYHAADIYLRDHGDALEPRDRIQLGDAVDNAVEVGVVTHGAADAFTRFAGEPGTWTEREAMMDAHVAGQPQSDEVRADGSVKGTGYLGPIKRPDGTVESELSIGVEIDGKETEIPTLVPGLMREQIDYLTNTPPDKIQTADPAMFKGIEDKAVAHAQKRIAAGKSPFANDGGAPFEGAAVPEKYQQKTLAAVHTMRVAAEKREKDQQGEVQDQFKEAIERNVPWSQIAGSVKFDRLSAGVKDDLRTYMNNVAAGKYSVTNNKVYDAVDIALSADPQAFTTQQIDARVMHGLLSHDDGEAFKKRITDAEKLKGILTPSDVVTQWAHDQTTTLGIDSSEESEARGKLKREANAAIRGVERATGKPIDVIRDLPALLDTITKDSVYRKGGMVFDRGGTDTAASVIPPEELQMAVQQFIFKNNRLPSADDLREYWLESQADGG